MSPDLTRRGLIVLALLLWAGGTIWSFRTAPDANSDRYDYAARAWNAGEGEGLSPLIVYPLRFEFTENQPWPSNFTRPPVWPAALVPLVRIGLEEKSAVVLAALLAAAVMLTLFLVARESHGVLAGAWAAAIFASGFVTVRAVWGGGPELLLAWIVLVLWVWDPAERGLVGHLAWGSLAGTLPLIHPVGWLWLIAALAARLWHYGRVGLEWTVVAALVVSTPWYAGSWARFGLPLLQSSAELARSLEDPGGLGPYRGLTSHPTLDFLGAHSAELLRLALHRIKEFVLHMDGWISWPAVALAVWAALVSPRRALRDVVVAGVAVAALSLWSPEQRMLLPLVPLACLWSSEGIVLLDRRWPDAILPAGILATLAPWVTPLGVAASPWDDARRHAHWQTTPSPVLIEAVSADGDSPFFTDSAALAWRSRRRAVFLPENPEVLRQLRERSALDNARLVALQSGSRSMWTATSQASWDETWRRADVVLLEEPAPAVFRLGDTDEVVNTPAAPEFPLAADFVPTDLTRLNVPPATREGLFLRADAAAALDRMVAAAAEDGLTLRVVSAYRSFARQKTLHAGAVKRHGAQQRWVARPGHSEHQMGTAIDVADAALKSVVDPSFEHTPEGRWVAAHGERFGFRISYTPDNTDESGYLPEPWHLRYHPQLDTDANP